MIINARNKLNSTYIKNFIDDLDKNEEVVALIEDAGQMTVTATIETFVDLFKSQDIEDSLSDKSEIVFMNSKHSLEITANDYRYWIAEVRNKKYARLTKLFNLENTTTTKVVSNKQVSSSNMINVIIGNKLEDKVEIIDLITAKQKDCINFINKEYAKNEIKHKFSNTTRFIINPENLDIDTIETSNEWLSFDELIEKGVFVL